MSKEMVASMAEKPIIFALANPTPEILPSEVERLEMMRLLHRKVRLFQSGQQRSWIPIHLQRCARR